VKESFIGSVRHLLTWFGGWLVSSGSMSGVEAQEFVGWGCAIAGLAWSIFHKVKIKKLIDGYEITLLEAQGKGIHANQV